MNPRLRRRPHDIAVWALIGFALALVPVQERRSLPADPLSLTQLPGAEFARLVGELSEEGGYFRSDNFTSNETAYLHVLGKLRELGASGGAYVGVGPEQNFTYIAKIRPAIAFIVDIRRQAVLQHLLYKTLFHVSETRADFLANLLGRSIAESDPPGRGATVDQLVEYFDQAPAAPDAAFAANLTEVRAIIETEFEVPLSAGDRERLGYVYGAFRTGGLGISFSSGQSGFPGGRFPALRDLLVERDLDGRQGSFLASDEDYDVVRNLHLRNRIIPVVGDFAGTKALAAVAGYLTENGYTVRAFYASNVEQYLFQSGGFAGFVRNLRRFPIDRNSVIIRSVSGRGQPHPARVAGHRNTTLLQRIKVLLEDFDEGSISSYRSLVMTHYIAGERP